MSNTIPEGWILSPIGEICIVAIGGTPSRSVSEYWDSTKTSGNPWVSIRDLKKPWIYETSEYITESGVKNSNVKLVRKGTVLMSFKLSVGRVAFAGRDLYTNEAIAAFISKKDNRYSDQFLYQGLQHWNLLENIDQAVKGVTLNKEKINQIEALLPPLPEQQKIAAILTTVDDVIEKTRAQIDKLKDLKTGMMQELLTKGIGPDGKPHTEFKDSPVGKIPLLWNIEPLKAICRRITDGTHQAVKTSDSGEIPFLYVSCIRNGEILWDKASTLTENGYKAASKGRVASPGDILYTAVGSYGHAAIVETERRFSFQRHIAFIQPDRNVVNSYYLMTVLNSTIGRSQADQLAIGNAQLTVTLGDLGTFLVPIPSLSEQERIAESIRTVEGNISRHERRYGALLNINLNQ
jgi:type I restriction enzyme S subunit